MKLLKYLAGQAGIITPLLFPTFIYYSVKGISLAIRSKGMESSRFIYLAWMSWPVLIFFALTTMKGKVAEANWPAPAYAAGLVLAWGVFRTRFTGKRSHRNFMAAAMILAAAVSITVQVHLLYPLIPLPPDKDPMRQFHSWRSLGNRIRQYVESNSGPGKSFLLSDKGTTVAEAVFYTDAGLTGLDFNHPERYFFLDTEGLKNKNALILVHNFSKTSPAPYRKYFESVEILGSHPALYRGKEMKGLSVGIMLGRNYKGGWKQSMMPP